MTTKFTETSTGSVQKSALIKLLVDRNVTFKLAVRIGMFTAADIDDWIDFWHTMPSGELSEPFELREMLGFSTLEYAAWMKDPSLDLSDDSGESVRLPYGTERITSSIIGKYVDSLAGNERSISSVAGRLLGESVELCLAAGIASGDILTLVVDAMQSQALKASHQIGHPMPISKLSGSPSELGEECADVGLILKDLCYVAGIDLDLEEILKLAHFSQKNIVVASYGTVSSEKPHLSADAKGPCEQKTSR